MQHGGEADKPHPFVRVLLPVPLRLVLVLPVQCLHLHVLLERRLHVLAPLYIKLNVEERFHPL